MRFICLVFILGGANPSSSGSCPGTTAAISGCSDAEPSISDSSKFNFMFWSCLSPKVTSMDLISGTSNDLITATGSGFGSNNCENEVMIGDGRGVVESASDSSFSFKIDPSTSPVIGTKQKLTLRVGNRGFALVDLANSTFALLPGVSSISPASGSTAGGTILTLTGSGFQGTTSDVSVNIDIYPCQIQSLTYTQIICSTPPLSAGKVEVSVIISVGGQQFTAECASCSYTYDAAASPTVSAVSPTTVSGSTTSLTVTGTLFGTTTADARVVIGGEECVVSTVTATQIDCAVGGVKTGTHPLEVYIAGKGRAVTSVTIDSPATISSLDPVQGSINGGLLLKINGNGFSPINTTVSIDGSDCPVMNVTFSLVVCSTPAHAVGSTNVIVTSETVSYTSQTFTYASGASPAVTSINPTQGTATNTLTITGTGFSSTMEDNSVTINNVPCVVTAASTTSIACTLGDVSSGAYPVVVNVAGFGFSDSNTQFTYEMTFSTISPSTGSSSGGQSVTLSGSGFVRGSMTVTVCGQPCSLQSTAQQTSTSYVCLTPPATGTVTATTQCDVVATVNTITQTLSNGYTYDASLTPEITGVSPARGGTAGGTTLTITGTGFGTTVGDVSVTIDSAVCNVTTVSATQIVCVTGPSKPSDTKVTVEIQGSGIGKQTSAKFYYIDVWSSRYTWGNQDPPTEGDLVIIPRNQTLLLDTDTAILKMLVIQGGKLIFDEKDVELKAENILILDGGVLQVGTEAEPFQHKGIITMFGNLRSPELPIYGAKCLAVRDGTLDLHGKPTHVTWSRLASTASAGATAITLEHPVEWNVGDQIVIATTSHRHSQRENEVRTIASISSDKLSLTLTKALTYTHIGISETFDGQTVEFRAEVGLLTHNVVVRGSRNMQWNDKIEACPDGFDTGEFATQTCFQGRFGQEMGSDQFGAQIMLHAPRKDENLAIGRISYIEVNYAGQAFRLGRYPIHLHLNGDMSASYVRGCAIHETFNRAINIHFTHNLLVEHNVIYNVMGGAFFLEDGIETGNIIQYNLGVFVRGSSSLLNDDITPAIFWVTNPNNTIRHNAAAGGSHFGFWYRMHLHPEGPSKTNTICPKHVPLGQFKNNTAHSFGWFGLWIFEDYFPKVGGSCSQSAASEVAVYESLTAWNCEKGAEAVNSGAIQFKDFILVNNEKAGYEGKLLSGGIPQYAEDGPMVRGGLIVGYSSNLDTEVSNGCTHGGVILPYQNGFMVKGTKFVNFDRSSCAAFRFTRITGTCSVNCGGFITKTTGLGFNNADRRLHLDWQHEGVIIDIDGSLTGSAGHSVVPSMGILPPAKCSSAVPFSVGTVPGSTCQADVKFHRFAFNNIKPSSLESKDVVIENQFGNVSGPYRFKRITHKPGWVVIMVDGESYKMSFENGEQVTNISYNGVFHNFESGQAMILTLQTEKKPDRVMIDGSTPRTEQTTDLDPSTMENGDWRYNYTTGTLSYIVSASQSRKRRGAIVYDTDRAYDFKAFRCYYTDCIPPPDPTTVLTRPNTSMLWSDDNTWLEMNITKPVDGDDLTIGRGMI
ncbi:fibrocystin-L [Patella vulgata]|uniref:fibrocystin-L n=1 Tax=Patella vulgata TaxID=6465 RepID=UPI0024A7E77D|nr:fibrocystin-L [Patella vulgata]